MTTLGAPSRYDVDLGLRPRTRVLELRRAPYRLSLASAVTGAAAAGLSLAFPGVLAGTAVLKGNLRGTAVAMLAVGLPVLLLAVRRTARGSARALVVWAGAQAYLLYQAVLFCFATPLNNLFLLYVAFLSTSLWAVVSLLRSTRLDVLSSRMERGMPVRGTAGFAMGLAALNALAWLAAIVPAALSDDPRSALEGSGLLTNPVWVQDLAVWLPALAVSAYAAWQRYVWGVFLTAGLLAMYALESVSIACDQWFGARAQSGTSWASTALVPAFAAGAAVVTAVLVAHLRHLDRRAVARG